MFKRFLVTFGLWLAHKGGWKEPSIEQIAEALGLAPDVIESAALMCVQAEGIQGVSGAYKQREVLRSMINRHPDVKERDLNLAIELVLHWTS